MPGASNTNFDRLLWLNASAHTLVGMQIVAVDPPVGPDGVLVLYGCCQPGGDLYAVAVSCNDDASVHEGMSFQRARVPK